jgi:hypothetical protein
VKPSNVLLTLDGPLLIDFGIARATDGTASLTSTGVSIGSPGYMSPEQILGKAITGAADVFSLGAVLAYAATGEPPFPGDSSASLLYKVVHEQPELGALSGDLRGLVAELLAKSPGDRPSPGDVARRLAPEGAARLVAGGWLPGALVEQVSRGAVRLLNLEVAEEVAGEVASGPVGFSSPSVGELSGAPTVGEFGPPPVMPGMPGMPVAAPAPSASVPGVVPEPRAPESRTPEPHDTVSPPSDARPGRLSVSVAATSGPGVEGRGRRMSCTVALAVAGALAAVTVGSVFVFDLLRVDRDDSAGSSDSDAYSSAPAGPSASTLPTGESTASDGGTTSKAVPDRYLGTWEGQGSGSGIPMGTFRLTVEQAAVGEELGKLRQTDIFGGVCNDVLTLKKVTKTELVTTSVGAKDNHGGCNPAAHTVRITAVGDDLQYVSESAAEGNPEARMSKVE